MASDFPVDAERLRKLLKRSRAVPIAFGYNDGTNDEDDEYLAAHPRKEPEMLGKIAKAEGAGTKSAYGTFAVDGNEVRLTCYRSTPQLAKKFKKYLRKFRIALNVVVMDPSGAVIDSDVEKLDDWFRDLEDANDLAEDAAEAVAELVEDLADPGDRAAAPVRDAEAATLAARLRSLQPKVAAAPPAAADRLARAFKAVIALIRAGETRQAAATIGQIEAILSRLASRAAAAPDPPGAPPGGPPGGPPATDAPASDDRRAADGVADARLPRLRDAVAALEAQVAAAAGDGAAPLRAGLVRARGLVDAGDAEGALAALRAVQAALKARRAARGRWERAVALVGAAVAGALAARGPADDDGLRAMWQRAVALAAEGAFERALDVLPAIVAALRASRDGGAAAPGADTA